jgi:hypothetical protein
VDLLVIEEAFEAEHFSWLHRRLCMHNGMLARHQAAQQQDVQ